MKFRLQNRNCLFHEDETNSLDFDQSGISPIEVTFMKIYMKISNLFHQNICEQHFFVDKTHIVICHLSSLPPSPPQTVQSKIFSFNN